MTSNISCIQIFDTVAGNNTSRQDSDDSYQKNDFDLTNI